MILSFLAGTVFGFLLSMPPVGPTNFAIVAKGFKNDVKAGVAIGAGAGVMDMVYILIAYGGVAALISILPAGVTLFFEDNAQLLKILMTFGGCFIVIFYGIKIMKMKITTPAQDDVIKKKLKMATEKAKNSVEKLHKTEKELEKILHHKLLDEEKDTNIAGNFFTGIFLCLSSITLPASWFALVGYLQGYGVITSNFFSGLLFAIGVVIGTTLWFYLLTKFISKNSHKISPKTLSMINVCVGIVLISLGAFLFYKAFDFALA